MEKVGRICTDLTKMVRRICKLRRHSSEFRCFLLEEKRMEANKLIYFIRKVQHEMVVNYFGLHQI